MDGKHSHAALGASRTACEPFAGAPRSIGQRGVYDLDQFPVASR
jgi:hypothetical protein